MSLPQVEGLAMLTQQGVATLGTVNNTQPVDLPQLHVSSRQSVLCLTME